MTIEYRGRNKEENRNHCEAWILYNEDNKKEEEKVVKICELIKKEGWEVFSDYGFIVIKVFDKEDYRDLVKVYKEAKKALYSQ